VSASEISFVVVDSGKHKKSAPFAMLAIRRQSEGGRRRGGALITGLQVAKRKGELALR
jgi:hypothetical protein